MIADFISSFVLGLLTPLTALCVLPLFPGFLAYLSTQMGHKDNKRLLALFGVIVTSGVITFMLLLGLIFTTLLQKSLTTVIGIVSPIAFAILLVISMFLIFNINVGKFLPQIHAPLTKNPLASAFVFGFFFGAIVIPCNPAFIATMFAKSLLIQNTIGNLINFLMFGLGMAAPLLLFSLVSLKASASIISFLTRYGRKINLIAGLLMFAIALYYLLFVFRIGG